MRARDIRRAPDRPGDEQAAQLERARIDGDEALHDAALELDLEDADLEAILERAIDLRPRAVVAEAGRLCEPSALDLRGRRRIAVGLERFDDRRIVAADERFDRLVRVIVRGRRRCRGMDRGLRRRAGDVRVCASVGSRSSDDQRSPTNHREDDTTSDRRLRRSPRAQRFLESVRER